MVDTVDTVYTVESVYNVDTVNTFSIETALHCLNISISIQPLTPLPLPHLRKIMLHFFWKASEKKAFFKGPKSAK